MMTEGLEYLTMAGHFETKIKSGKAVNNLHEKFV